MSTRGSSVVDYFIVPYEHIENHDNFKVFRPTTVYGENLNGVEFKIVPDY